MHTAAEKKFIRHQMPVAAFKQVLNDYSFYPKNEQYICETLYICIMRICSCNKILRFTINPAVTACRKNNGMKYQKTVWSKLNVDLHIYQSNSMYVQENWLWKVLVIPSNEVLCRSARGFKSRNEARNNAEDVMHALLYLFYAGKLAFQEPHQ